MIPKRGMVSPCYVILEIHIWGNNMPVWGRISNVMEDVWSMSKSAISEKLYLVRTQSSANLNVTVSLTSKTPLWIH